MGPYRMGGVYCEDVYGVGRGEARHIYPVVVGVFYDEMGRVMVG